MGPRDGGVTGLVSFLCFWLYVRVWALPPKKPRTEPTRPMGGAESPRTRYVPHLSPCLLVPPSEASACSQGKFTNQQRSRITIAAPTLQVLHRSVPLLLGSSNAQAQRGKTPGMDSSDRAAGAGAVSPVGSALVWDPSAPLTLTLLSYKVSLWRPAPMDARQWALC